MEWLITVIIILLLIITVCQLLVTRELVKRSMKIERRIEQFDRNFVAQTKRDFEETIEKLDFPNDNEEV